MGRPKRHGRQRRSPLPHHRKKGRGAGARSEAFVNSVLACFAKGNEPQSLAEILDRLHLPTSQRNSVAKILEQLCQERRLTKRGKLYQLSSASGPLLTARIDITAKGFGFAAAQDAQPGDKDIFIPPGYLAGAVSGDIVRVQVTGQSRGRREGRVVEIDRRAFTRICGIFTARGPLGYVHADNERLTHDILIRQGKTKNAADGMVVLVEITDYGSPVRGPEGRVLEILGPPDAASVQIRMTMEQFALATDFPAEVKEEAQALVPITDCGQGRTDLRHIEHVTIDGATARDFDDAIAVERTEGGFRLYVSIADVGAYVAAGSAIDREAYQRGTSVYLPDRVIPMLPERLSNDLCSLVPNQDRPAFTALLTFDASGQRTEQRFLRSMIRSRRRFTYGTVNAMLFLKDAKQEKAHRDLLPMLQLAAELASLLHSRRLARGSIGFNLPEAAIEIDGDRVASITLAERNLAHQLIEECMLAANEAVAETLETRRIPVLFRIHERPDPLKVESFVDAARAMGLKLPKTETSPAWFARVLAEAADTAAEYVINNLLLRTMQQARYAPENEGHFGLAAEHYLHFTSPIRRYPDLVAHRVLAAALTKEPGSSSPLPQGVTLVDAGLHLSQRERVSVDVERNIRARLAALYLLAKIGERFAGIISGVTSFGIFVELTDCFISGAVPVASMTDDYYLFDSRGHRMIGERTNRVYQLGQQLEVVLEHVDMTNFRITFRLAELARPPRDSRDQACFS